MTSKDNKTDLSQFNTGSQNLLKEKKTRGSFKVKLCTAKVQSYITEEEDFLLRKNCEKSDFTNIASYVRIMLKKAGAFNK